MTIKPSQTNQQINSLIPSDKKSIFYCYFALREFGDEIRARGSGGSVLLNLNKGQFETMSILKPPTDLIHKFQEFAEPLLERLLANEKESRMLASLRDSLLPKLMRGEAIVKNMET
jgi:type I restriction enzyme S subunit